MNIAEKIKERREHLHLTDVETANKIGISISEYGDIESYDDESAESISLYKLKKLCSILGLDVFSLFSIELLEENEKRLWSKPVNELIKMQRVKHGLSHEELGDILGYHGYAIEKLEKDSFHAGNWCLNELLNLSKALSIPPYVLIESGLGSGRTN